MKNEVNGCIAKIEGRYEQFTPAEKKVADFVLSEPKEIHGMVIDDVADEAGVSKATVTRFVQNNNFSSFNQFKTMLIPELLKLQKIKYSNIAHEEFSASDSVVDVMMKFNEKVQSYTKLAMNNLDEKQLELAVKSIKEARKIFVFGNGGSAYLANSLALKLMKIGMDAFSFLDRNTLQTFSLLLTEKDIAIAISHSGKTAETLDILSLAKGNGCKVIGCTSQFRSPLSKASDIKINYGDFDDSAPQKTEIGISRVIQAAVIELLATAVIFNE